MSKMEGAPPAPLALRLLLLVALPAPGWLTMGTREPPPQPSGAPLDGIKINVTTLKDDGEVSKEQVCFLFITFLIYQLANCNAVYFIFIVFVHFLLLYQNT